MTSTRGAKPFAMVGPFPPPRHGVSTVNEAIENFSRTAGIEARRFNTAPASLDRSWIIRLRRIGRAVKAIFGVWRFSRANRGCAVYLSLSGGLGLVYESAAAILARLGGSAVVLHHHSFRYIDASYWAMALLTKAAGRNSLHVVLGDEMAGGLRRRYPAVRSTLVLSNAWVVDGPVALGDRETGMRRVGYLANLSAAKGMFDVLETAEISARRGLDLEYVVAGPFDDSSAKHEFLKRAAEMKNLRYVGPVYGGKKRKFLDDLDVFIFPTRYRNEAEPIVVLEALRAGCPVIAYDRGCIPSLLKDGAGIDIPRREAFAPRAVAEFEKWIAAPKEFLERRRAARDRFVQLQLESRRVGHELLAFLGNPGIRVGNNFKFSPS